jgi:Leucine-rich repeat (LRR) protein
MQVIKHTLLLLALGVILTSCSNQFVVSINEQSVYDPEGRLVLGEVADADLQGCINLALQQQNLSDPTELTVLSCANSEISNLDKIGELTRLRFIDLGNNNLTNITPLEDLPVLSGVNLLNNLISDIGPLFNMPNLSSVNLEGNNRIPCRELTELREKLGSNLAPPSSCSE